MSDLGAATRDSMTGDLEPDSIDRRVIRQFVVPTLIVASIGLLGAVHLALLTPDPFRLSIFFFQYLRHELPGAALAIVMVLGAVLLARRASVSTIETVVEAFDRQPGRWAAAVFVVLGLSSLVVYQGHPLSMDEYAATFQARVFAAGRPWAELPPDMVEWLIPEPFIGYFFTASATSGRVVSNYWPGHSLMLAPFAAVGAPWLLNPLLAAGALMLLWYVARRLLPGTAAGGWAILFALASPEFTVDAISFYSMTSHLFMNLLFVALLLEPRGWRLFAAGVVGSLALVLHHPFPHVLFALPWIVWLAWGRGGLRRLAVLGSGYLPLVLLLGGGWLWLRAGIEAEGVAIAAGGDDGAVQSLRGLVEGAVGSFGMPGRLLLWARVLGYLKLFLWAVPGLPILAVLGWRQNRDGTVWRLLGLSALCSIVGYFFAPYSQGHGWGFRYFHQAWSVLPLLGAAFMVSTTESRGSWIRVVGLTALLSLAAGTGVRYLQVHTFIERHLNQLPPLEEAERFGRTLVFVAIHRGYYSADLVQNDPFLRDPVWMLASHGREEDERFVRAHFPEARLLLDNGVETVWVVD